MKIKSPVIQTTNVHSLNLDYSSPSMKPGATGRCWSFRHPNLGSMKGHFVPLTSSRFRCSSIFCCNASVSSSDLDSVTESSTGSAGAGDWIWTGPSVGIVVAGLLQPECMKVKLRVWTGHHNGGIEHPETRNWCWHLLLALVLVVGLQL
jgi:hypothetical protein